MDALLRRTRPVNRIEVEGLLWDEDQFELSYKKQLVKLTQKNLQSLDYS